MKNILRIPLLFGILLVPWTGLQAQWFTISEVAEKTWLMDDHRAANIYLVEGSDSALIIDTGIGLADLRSAAMKLTDKPLIVVNTHGHPDHVGANYQFEKVYLHQADFDATRSFMTAEAREGMGSMMAQGAIPSEEEIYKGKIHDPKLIPVSEGYIFDLGDRKIKVIETPGHTPGGICLLDMGNRFLFSGDNNNSLVWLFLEGCLPLSKYLTTLEKQMQMRSEFDTLFPGHGPGMDSDFIGDQIQCVRSILDGSCESKPYESFAGNGRVCTTGRATVAYNPENL